MSNDDFVGFTPKHSRTSSSVKKISKTSTFLESVRKTLKTKGTIGGKESHEDMDWDMIISSMKFGGYDESDDENIVDGNVDIPDENMDNTEDTMDTPDENMDITNGEVDDLNITGDIIIGQSEKHIEFALLDKVN